MRIERRLDFTINMGSFESVKTGASISLDSEEICPELLAAQGPQAVLDTLHKMADAALIQLTEEDLRKAGALTHKNDSFILTWDKVKEI